MDWVQDGNTYRSGSYVIELLGPRRWLLTGDDTETAITLPDSEDEWIGTRLSEMKAIAEGLEQEAADRAITKRHLTTFLVALIVITAMAGLPGRLPAIAVVAAAGFFVFALARLVDQVRQRPWDSLRSMYQ